MKSRFTTVPSNNNDGVTGAIDDWLGKDMKISSL
jgi:hypothetical protein